MKILVKNGCIIDGTGQPRFAASLAIEDERIAAIGTCRTQAVSIWPLMPRASL